MELKPRATWHLATSLVLKIPPDFFGLATLASSEFKAQLRISKIQTVGHLTELMFWCHQPKIARKEKRDRERVVSKQVAALSVSAPTHEGTLGGGPGGTSFWFGDQDVLEISKHKGDPAAHPALRGPQPSGVGSWQTPAPSSHALPWPRKLLCAVLQSSP